MKRSKISSLVFLILHSVFGTYFLTKTSRTFARMLNSRQLGGTDFSLQPSSSLLILIGWVPGSLSRSRCFWIVLEFRVVPVVGPLIIAVWQSFAPMIGMFTFMGHPDGFFGFWRVWWAKKRMQKEVRFSFLGGVG